jgi:MFS family permease
VAFRQHVLTEARRRLFRSRTFTAANAAAFLQSGAIFSAAFLTTEYFQLGLGYGPLATGLRLLPWTATPMIVAPLAGAFADRIGTRPLLVTGLALAGSAVAGAIGRRRAVARAASLDQRDGIPAATAARS